MAGRLRGLDRDGPHLGLRLREPRERHGEHAVLAARRDGLLVDVLREAERPPEAAAVALALAEAPLVLLALALLLALAGESQHAVLERHREVLLFETGELRLDAVLGCGLGDVRARRDDAR